jgi:outer membrane receptor protein involved in Fe transport
LNSSYTKTFANYKKGDKISQTNKIAAKDTILWDIVENIPSGKVNVAVSYKLPSGLSIFSLVKVITSVVKSADLDNNGTSDHRPGYAVWDLHLRQPVGNDFNVDLGIGNLLNTQYYFNADPAPNRSISLGITADF